MNRYSFNGCDPIGNGDEDGNSFRDDQFGFYINLIPDPYLFPFNPPVSCVTNVVNDMDHGTKTASVIVGDGSAIGANGQFGRKITGAAPGASLREYRGGFTGDPIRAADYAMKIRADVVSVQVGYENPPNLPVLRMAVQTLDRAGIVTIAAAGNLQNNPMLDVARIPEVISVGGIWNPAAQDCGWMRYTHPSGIFQWPEGSFTKPDLVAPANHIENIQGFWSCNRQLCEGYGSGMSNQGQVPLAEGAKAYVDNPGTSLSTPLVSGMAAIMFERNNEMLPADLKAVLESTAIDLGDEGKDLDYGSGFPQLDQALREIELINTFDRYLTQHARQVGVGGMPTNWTFDVDDNTVPIVGITDLNPTPFDTCNFMAIPLAGLRMQSPLTIRTLGYVWDEREIHEFTTTFRFDADPGGNRTMGLLLRWDPATRHCVYIRTQQGVPGDPTTTEFVFGHEETSGTGPYVTVPYGLHQFDFQDMSKDYLWTVTDDGLTVSLSVGILGGGPTADVLIREPYTTAVPMKYKGLFVQSGAAAIFDYVTVRKPPVPISVEEVPGAALAPPLSLAVTSLSGLAAATFEVTKKEGIGFLAVYDVTGRQVRKFTLPSATGGHDIRWDGKTSDGLKVPSGVYFARAVSGTEIAREKFVFLR